VTIYDVAVAADVSAATVSRVLNGTDTVARELVERVEATVEQLGYRPNHAARSLRRQVAAVWDVIISDIENPFFTALVRGIEDVGHEHGFSVVLCNTDEDLQKERRYMDVALAERVAGVIISPASEQETDLTKLVAQGVPIVAVDRRPSRAQVDGVMVDNALGADAATSHLIEQGATRIACITGPQRTTTAAERLAGYQAALDRVGLAPLPGHIRYADFKPEGGYQAARTLLQSAEPPDGLFVANSQMLLGVLAACRELGTSIPDELALVGWDDSPWATLVSPQLTVVSQPAYDLGRAAGDLLVQRSAGQPGPVRRVTLLPTLVVRESSVRRSVQPSGGPSATAG
jgi:LacI family transcriptional regulator